MKIPDISVHCLHSTEKQILPSRVKLHGIQISNLVREACTHRLMYFLVKIFKLPPYIF